MDESRMKAKYEIGTKLYFVEQKSNWMTRQRISMTDSNGVEWHRHTKPLTEFNLKEHTIVGTIVTVIEGIVDADGEYENQYFVNDIEFNILEYEIDQEKSSGDRWFTDKAKAEEYIQHMTKETNEI
jgi:hypothetical protein